MPMSTLVSARRIPLLFGLATRTQVRPVISGPISPLAPSSRPQLTFVTKRRKLFDTNGKLNASLCELNSLTLPIPATLTLCCILGRFAGSKLLNSISETFVERDDVVGTENFRGAGAGGADGGKDGARLGRGTG